MIKNHRCRKNFDDHLISRETGTMTKAPQRDGLERQNDSLRYTRREFVQLLGGISLLAITGGIPGRSSAATSQWDVGVSMPFAAQEIYPAVSNGRIAVAGGISQSTADPGPVVQQRTMIYSQESNRWSAGPDLPEPHHHIALATRADEVLAIGGYTASQAGFWQMQSRVFVLDHAFDSWTEGPALPERRAEFAAGTIDGHIIVASGRKPHGRQSMVREDHTNAAETFLLPAGESIWQSVASIPTPRSSSAGVVLEGRLHVIGGCRNNRCRCPAMGMEP